MKKALIILMALALMALVGGAATAIAKSSAVKMKAKIVGVGEQEDIRGKARYESKTKSDGRVESRFRVQIQRIGSDIDRGTMLDVFLDGEDVGDMKVKSHHEAKLDLRSKRGDTVPVPSQGDKVEVRLDDDTVIAEGTF